MAIYMNCLRRKVGFVPLEYYVSMSTQANFSKENRTAEEATSQVDFVSINSKKLNGGDEK